MATHERNHAWRNLMMLAMYHATVCRFANGPEPWKCREVVL